MVTLLCLPLFQGHACFLLLLMEPPAPAPSPAAAPAVGPFSLQQGSAQCSEEGCASQIYRGNIDFSMENSLSNSRMGM